MAWIVQSLNEEWATVASSPAARRALMRWTSRNPALATAHSVDDFVDTRTRPGWGDQALRVLAAEAPDDEIAAAHVAPGAARWAGPPRHPGRP